MRTAIRRRQSRTVPDACPVASNSHDVSELQRQNVTKKTERVTRSTIYFSPEIHKALKLRAAAEGSSISQWVNAIVTAALAEDAADFDAFLLHQDEDHVSFESFICGLRRRGRL